MTVISVSRTNFVIDDSCLLLILCTIALSAFLRLSEGFQGCSLPQRRKSLGLSMLIPVRGGSIVALVTPMTRDNAIDYTKLESLLKWHIAEGSWENMIVCHTLFPSTSQTYMYCDAAEASLTSRLISNVGTDGAVILGTTGEASMISMEERTEIIKTSVRVVNGAFPVIVGTGTIETHKVIALSQHALDCGADATLVITPYYVKPPQRALITHFRKIADSVALPMIVYNCPGRTGVDLKPETIAEFSSHPRIIGVKDATGDITRVESLRNLCGKEFMIFSGEDDLGCEFVRLGGDGVISVTANVAPAAMHT